MIRSTIARVDLDALRHNFAAIQQYLAVEPGRTPPGIIAVVKANAYGHGAERVALALEQAGATMLACADIEEGIVLRRAGVRVPVLVFGALSVSDLDGLFEYSLTPTISTPGAARAVQAAAVKRRSTIGYHLKIDTGMNRLGFRHDNLRRTLPEVLASDHLRLEGVFTHFASADEPESPVFNTQRERFDAACDVVSGFLGPPKLGTSEGGSRTVGPPEGGHVVRARVQQRGAAARLARLVRRRAARPPAVRHRPAAARVDDSAAAGHVADEPCRGGQGRATRRGRRLRLAFRVRTRRGRSPSFRPATPMASTRACADAATS